MKQNSFDAEKFKSLSTIDDKIKYCDNNLKFLSEGCTRKVYQLDESKVIKVVYKENGYIQNKKESINFNYNFPFLTKVYDYDSIKYSYIISELCHITLKVDSNKYLENQQNIEIKRVTGYDAHTIWFLGNMLVIGNIDDYKKIKPYLIKCLDVISILRLSKKYKDVENAVFVYQICNMLYLPNKIKDILLTTFLNALWYIAREYRLGNKINYRKILNLIDSGEYTKIDYLTEILKVKSINSNIIFSDSFNTKNTGIVKRDNKEYLVALDYGWYKEGIA